MVKDGDVNGAADDGADIRTLDSGVVYQDNWMRVRRDEIERRDGDRAPHPRPPDRGQRRFPRSHG